MSQLDDLLARSQSPGRFVERRRFTLSRDKAIEKQREFALRHPSQYVLELIQAAVFAGATYIAVDSRSTRVLVAWVGGRGFQERELSQLLDYLFADRGDPQTRHLVQLAVGVNALLQRRPKTLRIETGHGEDALRLDLDSAGGAQIGRVQDPIGGTYLYAELGGGWFKRFTASHHTPEQGLIEERCLYTPVPILLNGAAPFGYRGSRHIEIFGAQDQVHFDEQGRRGVVAVHSSPYAPTGFRVVVGGVWISTVEPDALASSPLVGVVCDDRLRKTADHSDVVRDNRYVELLHAVQPHANTLLQRVEGSSYRPPALPPIPEVTSDDRPQGAEIAPEPLDEPLACLAPRAPVPLASLKAERAAREGATPLFCCTPELELELREAADPLRFPYRVLLLTPGQAITLEQQLPDIPLHRLQSKSDVDFVRRIIERQVRLRTQTVRWPGGQVQLRLHLEGAMPDWGGSEGVPFVVVEGDRTLRAGSIVGREVRLHADRVPDEGALMRWGLQTSLQLPRVSLVIEPDHPPAPSVPLPDDELVQHLLDAAWQLAVPEDDEPHRPLLRALLGHVAVPQLQAATEGEDRRVHPHAALPPPWPDALRHIPLVDTEEGALSLNGLLGLLGTDRVVRVRQLAALEEMEALEARFGFGHLTHPALEDRALFGVGRIGSRWVWLAHEALWQHPGLTQMIWVSATFSPPLGDDRWTLEQHPFPEIVAVRAADEPGEDWQDGFELLFKRLYQLDADDSWESVPHTTSPARARGMGRLALCHLAVHLGHDREPLLMPSDGGARRSLAEVREEPAARVVPRDGVEVAEPWTFLLTADELVALDPEGRVSLRYDDAPEVWRDLADGDDTGWLLRQEVRQAGVEGWLGLRHPYDGTTGILVRTTGRLIALPEMDRRVPCHGLLRSVSGGTDQRALSSEQLRLLHLAGLRLYQETCGALRSRTLDPEREATARLYAFAFAKLAWRRGRLTGTALELARLVEVHDDQGEAWGTVEQWLQASPEQRPPRPKELVLLDDPVTLAPLDDETSEIETSSLHHRLAAIIAQSGIKLRMSEGTADGSAAVHVLEYRSTRDQLVLFLNQRHPLARAGIATAGPAREALLLEAARQMAVWAQARNLPLDLLEMQQILLAQRLDLGA